MNIFESIITKEDNVTELIKTFCQYKSFRKKFLKFLDIEENIEDENIYTQYELSIDNKKYGIADLYLEADEKIYIIEIKTNLYTNLSAHQKNEDYEKYIEKTKKIGEVIYFIPKAFFYKDLLKDKKIRYWEEFIKIIEKDELSELNIYINDFINALKNWFEIKKIKFSNYEKNLLKGETVNITNVAVPELIEKMFEIVENVKNKVDILNNKSTTEQNAEFYGYFLKHNKSDTVKIWFGVDFELWKAYNIPFSIQIITDDEISNIGNLKKWEEHPFGNSYIYYEPIDYNNENIIEEFIEKLNEIKKQINAN